MPRGAPRKRPKSTPAAHPKLAPHPTVMRSSAPNTKISLMDSVAVSAAGRAVADLDPAVRAFAARILGVPAEDVAPWLSDHIHPRGWAPQLRVLARAANYTTQAAIDPQPVPLKILSPVLAAASLEEESADPGASAMERRWAALLARAAHAGGRDIPPSFPAVLRDLSYLEAEALAVIADGVADNAADGFPVGELHAVLESLVPASELGLTLALENLYRLRLARSQPAGSRIAIWPTVFGLELARACLPPAATLA